MKDDFSPTSSVNLLSTEKRCWILKTCFSNFSDSWWRLPTELLSCSIFFFPLIVRVTRRLWASLARRVCLLRSRVQEVLSCGCSFFEFFGGRANNDSFKEHILTFFLVFVSLFFPVAVLELSSRYRNALIFISAEGGDAFASFLFFSWSPFSVVFFFLTPESPNSFL